MGVYHGIPPDARTYGRTRPLFGSGEWQERDVHIAMLLAQTGLNSLQLVLCNPICTAVYAVVSWRFFKERVEEEEILLINFFGEDYVQYQRRVPTGLPFIVGFKPSDF